MKALLLITSLICQSLIMNTALAASVGTLEPAMPGNRKIEVNVEYFPYTGETSIVDFSDCGRTFTYTANNPDQPMSCIGEVDGQKFEISLSFPMFSRTLDGATVSLDRQWESEVTIRTIGQLRRMADNFSVIYLANSVGMAQFEHPMALGRAEDSWYPIYQFQVTTTVTILP